MILASHIGTLRTPMILHTPTLFAVIVVLSFALSASIGVIGFRRHRDLFLWSAALALHGLAYVLFGLRGQINDFLSIVVGNLMVATMFALFGEAIYRFQQRPSPHALLWTPVAVVGIGFSLLMNDLTARSVLSALIYSLQCIFLLMPIGQRRQQTEGRGQYILAVGVLCVLGVLVARALAVSIGGVHLASSTESSPLQGLSYLLSMLGILWFVFGLIMMNQERAEQASQRATAELQRSEEQHRLLVETANEGICVIEGAAMRFVNPKLRELLGYSEFEILNRPVVEFIHEDDRQTTLENHRKRVLGLADVRYAIRVLTKNRGVRWFEINGTAFEWQGRPATLNFMNDITERKLVEEQVQQLAFHDPLTRLPNRRLLMDRLELTLTGNKRSGRRSALLFMDLDNFKPLNDTHGHSMGDLLLVQVAERLKTVVRETDFISRFGGDEFIVLIGSLDAEEITAQAQAMEVAEKIRDAVASPYHLVAHLSTGGAARIEHLCSASIGVVQFSGHGDTKEELLKRADAAMYRAKQAGRNAVRTTA